MERLFNKKVYVGKFSKEIQEKLFKLGFQWGEEKIEERKKPNNLDSPFLFCEKNCFLSHTKSLTYFNDKIDYEEVSIEYILNIEVEDYLIVSDDNLRNFFINSKGRIIKDFKYIQKDQKWFRQFSSHDEALAYRYLPTLLKYRDDFNKNWKPDWNDSNQIKYYISVAGNDFEVGSSSYNEKRILSFKSKDLRNLFLKKYIVLLEICKPLL